MSPFKINYYSLSSYLESSVVNKVNLQKKGMKMSIKRRPLVAGNWKMNGLLSFAKFFADDLVVKVNDAKSMHFDLLLCPPATVLSAVEGIISGTGIFLGGQDCHIAANGAHTGDISAEMLKDLGCKFVIIGHSERRADYFETDEIVKFKSEAALRENLIAIICVGETEIERKKGITNEIVKGQISSNVPASLLREHSDCTLFLDAEAATQI